MQTELATKTHTQAGALTRDLLLNALTVSSGAVDAISFVALGKVFTAFMTGNIAFLGLRVADAIKAPGIVAILTAMASFAVGVYVSTSIVKPSKESGIWSPRVTAALGLSLIPHAVFPVLWLSWNGRPSVDAAHVLLGLWGLAMGMQSAAVRRLHVDGVFTTAATATIIFLAGDLTNWSATAAERRRLAGVLVALFVGATAGGVLLVHAPLYAPVLPFVITAAVVATAAAVLREPDRGEGSRCRHRTTAAATDRRVVRLPIMGIDTVPACIELYRPCAVPARIRADGAWPHHAVRERHSRSVMYQERAMSIIRSALGIGALALMLALPAAAESPAVGPSAKDESDAAAVIAKFKQKDPALARVFAESAGYVVFPTVAKGGLGIGGARGKGYVYEHGRVIGRSTLTQVTVGLQAGGQAYSEVIFFKDSGALANFKRGHLKLDAQASAIALTERVGADLPYRDGIAIVTMAEGGLMYEASVGGQKLSFHPV
jgi:uncharacterized membrane protein YoaK (UPF0700 family)/lipid-binding SYLF domain-containing protein